MFPAMLMPMVSTMSRVALPVIRDGFSLPADVTAWVDAAFSLPFMVLMTVYGRLSDGLDKRRLIMAGIVIYTAGTALVLSASSLTWLVLGRIVQGSGAAAMMPLCIALISSLFPVRKRGRALGTWCTVGPATGFLGPLVAGLLVSAYGWRGAFGPPLAFGFIALLAVHRGVPSRPAPIVRRFLRSFDWAGASLLAAWSVGFVFYLSSRSITGAPPLRDWRLLMTSLLLLSAFIWWERRRKIPFVSLSIFANRMFLRGSFCASLRMVGMGSIGFLMPLYLVDVYHVGPARLGGLLMISAGTMTLIVRFGGWASDRWGSRLPVVIGLTVQALAMFTFSRLPSSTSTATVASVLAVNGLGVGLMLAALHRAVMRDISEAQMGSAAGLYSMLRFLGAVVGTAASGVYLQAYLDAGLSTIEAYQSTFLAFATFPFLGIAASLTLRE
jgi:MFS family permease